VLHLEKQENRYVCSQAGSCGSAPHPARCAASHGSLIQRNHCNPSAEDKCPSDLVAPWAARLETLGWSKIMVEFECGFPPNGHRKLVANHKDGLRADPAGNLVMDDLAAFVAKAVAQAV